MFQHQSVLLFCILFLFQGFLGSHVIITNQFVLKGFYLVHFLQIYGQAIKVKSVSAEEWIYRFWIEITYIVINWVWNFDSRIKNGIVISCLLNALFLCNLLNYGQFWITAPRWNSSQILRRVSQVHFLIVHVLSNRNRIDLNFKQFAFLIVQLRLQRFILLDFLLQLLPQIVILYQQISNFILQLSLHIIKRVLQMCRSFLDGRISDPIKLQFVSPLNLLDNFLENHLIQLQSSPIWQHKIGALDQFIVVFQHWRRVCKGIINCIFQLFIQIARLQSQHLLTVIHDGLEKFVKFDHTFELLSLGQLFKINLERCGIVSHLHDRLIVIFIRIRPLCLFIVPFSCLDQFLLLRFSIFRMLFGCFSHSKRQTTILSHISLH